MSDELLTILPHPGAPPQGAPAPDTPKDLRQVRGAALERFLRDCYAQFPGVRPIIDERLASVPAQEAQVQRG